MLVLARNVGQSVVLDDRITITVLGSRGTPCASGSRQPRTSAYAAGSSPSSRPPRRRPGRITTEYVRFGHDHDGIGAPLSNSRRIPG